MKQVYGDNCLFRAKVHEWFKRFKDGREYIKDDEHPGQESFVITPSNIEIVREFMKNDPKFTLYITSNIFLNRHSLYADPN